MKKRLFLFFICYLCIHVQAQEIKYELMFDTVDLMKIIPRIDSLNNEFEKRKNFQIYNSIKQSTGTHISLYDLDCSKAAQDLKNGISLDKFLKKYPETTIERNVLITQTPYIAYPNVSETRYDLINPSDYFMNFDIPDSLPKNTNSKIIYKYYHSCYIDSQSIEAFYLYDDFKSTTLPEKYAKMLDYVNTIFDTATIMYPLITRKNFDYSYYRSSIKVIDSFMTVCLNISTPFTMYDYYFAADIEKNYINSYLLQEIKNKLDTSSTLKALFKRAMDVAISNGCSNNGFEYLVEKLVSYKTALNIKQKREPNRSCGNDNAPKIHDYNVSNLALKTGDLKLFLKSAYHVMRDRIEGGRYDTRFNNKRTSYVSDFDFIHIDLHKYFLGTFLSYIDHDNSYQKDYYKQNELYDFKDRAKIETEILNAIKDDSLDRYNRLRLCQLFANYCKYEKDATRKTKNIIRLKNATVNFPACIKFNYAKYIEEKY